MSSIYLLLGLHFGLEDRGSTFLRNVSKILSVTQFYILENNILAFQRFTDCVSVALQTDLTILKVFLCLQTHERGLHDQLSHDLLFPNPYLHATHASFSQFIRYYVISLQLKQVLFSRGCRKE
jgi:hypothetical protein